MNKTQLVERIAGQNSLSKKQVQEVVEDFLTLITKTLVDGEDVTIPGFGSFTTGFRSARTGRNPRTGEALQIPAQKYPKFTAGKTLKEAVQEA